MSDTLSQVVDGGLRAAPPVTLSAASFLGMGLEDWMYIFTIIYTIIQGAYLVYRWRHSHNKRKKEDKNVSKQDN